MAESRVFAQEWTWPCKTCLAGQHNFLMIMINRTVIRALIKLTVPVVGVGHQPGHSAVHQPTWPRKLIEKGKFSARTMANQHWPVNLIEQSF